jgi:hypothetical protein
MPKIYCDYHCEIADLVPATELYYEFDRLPDTPGAIYIVGRTQLNNNLSHIRKMAESGQYVMVFSNPAEGSETLDGHLTRYGIRDLVQMGQLKCIAGGSMPEDLDCLVYDHFLAQPERYSENVQAQTEFAQYWNTPDKPYQFLFLNGRARPHRIQLIQQLGDLLDQALWSCLDGERTHTLPTKYEFPFFKDSAVDTQGWIKPQLFRNLWGEIYLHAPAYQDTYFSLVTETVFYQPWSFRTEKIAKCLYIGHPWICAANTGFYRDLRNLGFRTFDPIIDESFDSIDDPTDRLARIVAVTRDTCAQDMLQFMSAVEPICKYNQQHLVEITARNRAEFPACFLQYINE